MRYNFLWPRRKKNPRADFFLLKFRHDDETSPPWKSLPHRASLTCDLGSLFWWLGSLFSVLAFYGNCGNPLVVLNLYSYFSFYDFCFFLCLPLKFLPSRAAASRLSSSFHCFLFCLAFFCISSITHKQLYSLLLPLIYVAIRGNA